MQAFLDSIVTKLSGSAISNDVGGRCFQGTADVGTGTPYLVYSIVSAVPDRTFSEHYHDILLQVDLFSAQSAGPTEITTLYTDLIALLDECSLTITGYTLVWCREQNLVTMIEDLSALQDGTNMMNHYAVDFDVRLSLN